MQIYRIARTKRMTTIAFAVIAGVYTVCRRCYADLAGLGGAITNVLKRAIANRHKNTGVARIMTRSEILTEWAAIDKARAVLQAKTAIMSLIDRSARAEIREIIEYAEQKIAE